MTNYTEYPDHIIIDSLSSHLRETHKVLSAVKGENSVIVYIQDKMQKRPLKAHHISLGKIKNLMFMAL